MRTFAIALVVVAGLCSSLHASVSGLYNTGVDNSGAVLPYGSVDSHYVITASPDGAPLPELTMDSSGGFPIGPWLGDDALSRWDSESNDGHGNEGVGPFYNVTTFTSSVTGTVWISGQWATDNEAVGITLNGVTVNAGNNNEFSVWTPFSISGAVVAGTNVLNFISNNDGGPGGVRVEFTSATTPEPASLVVWGLAITGGLVVARRRRKA